MTISETILMVSREIRNFFAITSESGDFTVENSVIKLSGKYLLGQYILISGSILNDGVYLPTKPLCTLEGARDEQFNGTVYGLSIPRDFLDLCGEIKEFMESDAGKASSLSSETVIGVYSHTRGTKDDGSPVTWKDVFAGRLNRFRKMFAEVKI